MSESMKPFEGQLQLSSNLDYFRNGDEFYVYHNLFGYILKMSHDVIEFLEYFRPEPRDATDALQHFHGRFSDDMIGEFANVLAIQSCLLAPDETEETKLMKMHPMHARWITVHDPDDGPVTIYALDQETKAHIYVARLDGWDSQLWRAINGEKTVAELVEEMRNVSGSPVQGLEQRVLATLAQLTHCDMQVLKMSGQPASTYKHRRHGTPPYLISTMPYEKVTAELSPAGGGPVVAVSGRKTEAIDEELLERDVLENRVAFLFREQHPALHDQTYGERLLNHTIHHNGLSDSPTILEIGGGVGTVARGFLDALASRDPERYQNTSWVIVTPSERYAEGQRETLSDHDCVEVVVSEDEKFAQLLEGKTFDLAICNEFAAALPAVSVRKLSRDVEDFDDEEEDLDEEEDELDEDADVTERKPPKSNGKSGLRDTFIGEGDAVQYIFQYALPLDDSPADFHLNVGPIKLLEQVNKVLDKERGQFYLIEFGELYRYPVRTLDESGVSYSLHFGHIGHVGKKLGLDSEFGYLMDELEFERDMEMLATTRSQYKALRHLLHSHDVPFHRKAWSRQEFEGLLEEHELGDDQIYEIAYEPLEDRVLGFVMHSLKLMRLFRPVDEEEQADVEI